MGYKITENTTLSELNVLPGWREVVPYLVYSQNGLGGGLKMNMSLREIHKAHGTWDSQDMIYGLNRVNEILESGGTFQYSVYKDTESTDMTDKKDVMLFHFPAKSRYYVILAAGGAYGAVCSLAESFPVAAKLNELGITVFCLNYRVGGPKLFPKPMDDLAAAYGFLAENADELCIEADNYAVGGFSAGGHLAASWGTKSIGYKAYGYTRPQCLILGYPLINVWDTLKKMPLPIRLMMIKGYFGKDNAKEICRNYEIIENMDEDYPPTFMIQAKDDSTVPISNTQHMKERMSELGIRYEYEQIAAGGHGFGLGTGTDAGGWTERAVRFWQSL